MTMYVFFFAINRLQVSDKKIINKRKTHNMCDFAFSTKLYFKNCATIYTIYVVVVHCE